MFTFTFSAGAIFCIGLFAGVVLSAVALVGAALIVSKKK